MRKLQVVIIVEALLPGGILLINSEEVCCGEPETFDIQNKTDPDAQREPKLEHSASYGSFKGGICIPVS